MEPDAKAEYTWEEIRRHRRRKDCWIVIDGHVLDVSRFLERHPVGGDIILEHAGTDATDIFEKVGHGNEAYERMLTYRIGRVRPEGQKIDPASSKAPCGIPNDGNPPPLPHHDDGSGIWSGDGAGGTGPHLP